MPPMYDWRCKTCGGEVMIIRKMSESEDPPTKDEINKDMKDAGLDCGHPQLEKFMKSAPKASYGTTWAGGGGGKGRW